jgi:hypothetical protein
MIVWPPRLAASISIVLAKQNYRSHQHVVHVDSARIRLTSQAGVIAQSGW